MTFVDTSEINKEKGEKCFSTHNPSRSKLDLYNIRRIQDPVR